MNRYQLKISRTKGKLAIKKAVKKAAGNSGKTPPTRGKAGWEKKKEAFFEWYKSRWWSYAFFPLAFLFTELVFHLYVFRSADFNLFFPALFGLSYGLLAAVLTGAFPRRCNLALGWVFLGIIWLFANLQLVYGHIFKTFISVYSVQQNAGDAAEFWGDALKAVLEMAPGIFLLSLPLILYGLWIKRGKWKANTRKFRQNLLLSCITIVLFVCSVLSLRLAGRDAHTPYELYHKDWIMDLGLEKLGITTATVKDFIKVFGGDEELEEEAVFVPLESLSTTAAPPSQITAATGFATEGTLWEQTPAALVTPVPTPVPIDTSPNILKIDFKELADQEKDPVMKGLHQYTADSVPTKKNEYTGMFEGYNLIFLTAEGFSPWAVDEEITPTLYKLVNNGFVFQNFYTPIWYTSTSDGEYVACLGQIPYSTNSFKRLGKNKNALPFAFGQQFKKLGYTAKAWHNHSYTYYGRDMTHPLMGYDFKAKGHGLKITPAWPESDLEMMELTIPEFIGDEKFHAYYMTVSGHMEYNFNGNQMSLKNKHYVKDLPYTEGPKAYIACNKELDLALEYLIQKLMEAGIADKTVIALSTDHYPYGLKKKEIDELAGHEVEENFEIYKNNFILWSPSIKEPIVIDKYCSSLDIAPTLSNLFGLEYDSRLFAGSDILSDAPPLVIFSNESFITDRCMYNSKNKEITMLTKEDLPEGYIENVLSVVKNKFLISKNILLNDYFSYLMPYLD